MNRLFILLNLIKKKIKSIESILRFSDNQVFNLLKTAKRDGVADLSDLSKLLSEIRNFISREKTKISNLDWSIEKISVCVEDVYNIVNIYDQSKKVNTRIKAAFDKRKLTKYGLEDWITRPPQITFTLCRSGSIERRTLYPS